MGSKNNCLDFEIPSAIQLSATRKSAFICLDPDVATQKTWDWEWQVKLLCQERTSYEKVLLVRHHTSFYFSSRSSQAKTAWHMTWFYTIYNISVIFIIIEDLMMLYHDCITAVAVPICLWTSYLVLPSLLTTPWELILSRKQFTPYQKSTIHLFPGDIHALRFGGADPYHHPLTLSRKPSQ